MRQRDPGAVETVVRTGIGLAVLPASLIASSLLALGLALRHASTARLHRVYVGFARLCLRVGGTRLEVHGDECIEAGQSYVVVSNHESAWDPPCIVAGLPDVRLRFVAKQAIMRIPIFGQALRLTGNVSVVRHATARDVEQLRDGMTRRAPDVSMLFFAEGTRSRNGALQPFKKGAFATALGFGLPVLPVAVAGTYAIWPKGTLRLRRGPAVIEVGDPLPTAGLRYEDRDVLRDQAREVVGKLRARARERLRLLGHEPGGID